MALSRRAWLPLLLSFCTGVGVTYAIVYVGQHTQTGATRFALGFAVLVLAIWLYGFVRTWSFLNQYGRENAELHKSETLTALDKMAQEINVGQNASSPALPRAPLLARRVAEAGRSLRRGVSPTAEDLNESGERRLSGPERELRTCMDIALNVGIAGTFFSILVTLGQPQGLTAETLLAHVGPGMTSGLAAVIANVGLRLCHRALQDEQDELTEKVDDTLSDAFLAKLNRTVLNPEDRLVTSTQKSLVEQSAQFESVLENYAGRIGYILTNQVQQPIEQIAKTTGKFAEYTGAMAQHSGTWAEIAADLKNAHTSFLHTQNDAQTQHEARLAEQFTQFRNALHSFLEIAHQAHRETLQETQTFSRQLLQEHSQTLANMTQQLQTQFTALQAEQEAAHRRLTQSALDATGKAVDAQLAAVEERITGVLLLLETRLPDTLRVGMQGGLSETVGLLADLREQAGELAHTIQQVGGNANRQAQEYKLWNERTLRVQGEWEQSIRDGQKALQEWEARRQTEPTSAQDVPSNEYAAAERPPSG